LVLIKNLINNKGLSKGLMGRKLSGPDCLTGYVLFACGCSCDSPQP